MKPTRITAGPLTLARLNGVPIDGQWRSTAEICELMRYNEHYRSGALLELENFGHLEMNNEGWSGGYLWRRTDA